MAEATRCLEMTPMGCTACADGSFIFDGECFPCPDGCAACIQSYRCDACHTDRILNDGRCLGKGEVRDCAEVSGSRCTRCTGSLRYPNSDGTACQSWMFIAYIVIVLVGIFIMLVIIVVALIVAFNRLYISMRMKEQNRQFNINKIKRPSISFKPTGEGRRRPHDDRAAGRVRNRQTVRLHGQRRERREGPPEALLLHDGPKQLMLPRHGAKAGHPPAEKACAFNVLITPTCTGVVDELLALTAWHGAPHAGDAPARAQAPDGHPDEAALHRGPHGAADFRGDLRDCLQRTFRGNDVAVKRLNEVTTSDKAMTEFTKEVAMLDKFRCDQIVHFSVS